MLTLLMATYNGSATLPTVLDAYCRLESPKGGWKLVVVDNGSTDQTRQIVASFSQRLPLEYLFEAKRGKNAACNAGLQSLAGDLIVFTDDDAVPRPDWLQRLREAADTHTQFAIFGGRIIPRWEVPPPPWILNRVHLGITYGISDPAWGEGPVLHRHVGGANMAVRARIFEEGYRFDPAIGPQAGNYPMGSETELLLRLSQAYKSWYCPQAVVEHMIRGSQMTEDYVFSKAMRYGRGLMRLDRMKTFLDTRGGKGIAGLTIRALVRLAIAGLRGDADGWFRGKCLLRYLAGGVIEWRALQKGNRSADR